MPMLRVVVKLMEMMMEWVEMTTAIRGGGGGTTSLGTTTPPVLRPMYTMRLEMVVGIYSEIPLTTTIR